MTNVSYREAKPSRSLAVLSYSFGWALVIGGISLIFSNIPGDTYLVATGLGTSLLGVYILGVLVGEGIERKKGEHNAQTA